MNEQVAEEWEAFELEQSYSIEDMSVESLVDDWDRLVADEEQLDDEDRLRISDLPVLGAPQQVSDVDMQTITASAEPRGSVDQPQPSISSSLTCIFNGMPALPADCGISPALPVDHSSLPAALACQTSMQALLNEDMSMHSLSSDTSQQDSISNDNGRSLLVDRRIDTDIGREQDSNSLSCPGISSVAACSGDAPTSRAKAYMESLNMQSGLHVVAEAKVAKAYQDNAEYGLFALFFTATFRRSLQTWTSDVLAARGKAKLTESEFNAYCGLEIAMSVCPLNEISEYWSDSRFLGQAAFIETMPRTRFQDIRAALQFHPPEDPTLDKLHDPLWHSRTILAHFQKRFAEFAVPTGVSSIDEMTVRTKARSRARTYMPSKPDKYGVRFYAVVGWDSLYVHSVWDNSSGNTQRTTPAQRYTQRFPLLRTALFSTLARDDIAVSGKSATALWLAMVGHQSKILRSPSGYRLMVSDNFYTRHTFASAILAFTDGEMHTIGTVRTNLIDKWNKPAVEDSIRRVAEAERGTWELVAAVNPEAGWKKKEADHQKAQKKRPAARQTAYQPSLSFANRAGYVVYKDRKVVIFYSNDLHATPSVRTLPGTSDEAVACCHGLYPIQRWTDDRVLHRKIFMAPTVVAVYNRFMNGVDRVDQLRSTNPTRRREKRLDMTLFTWLLDMATINAFSLMKRMTSTNVTLREFKRRQPDTKRESAQATAVPSEEAAAA